MNKQLSRREFLKIVGAGSAGLTLAACGASSTPTQAVPAAADTPTSPPAGPKILRFRLYGDIQNLDPAHRISTNDDVVADAVMDGLVRYAPNSYDIVNQLAESIEQSDDGLSVTFKLKEGVQWHKGYGEVTTEDVKYSYERFLDPELNAAYADDWATLDHVEVIDKYNGKIILKEPFAPLWKTTLPVGSGNIVCKKFVEEIGNEAFATNIIGSGPYIYDDWKPDQMVVLKRNADYHGQQPYWDEIHLIPITEDKAAEVALEAGELDFGRISLAAVDRFEGNPDLKVWKKPSLGYSWIGLNVQHPKLQDINVRQAIRYAIDVPSILKAAYMGQAEQQRALIPPGLVGYWEDAPKVERDVEKAKEYLKKAGLESLDLRFDVEDTTEYRSWAEIAQQNLKEVGINVELNTMDSATYWTTSFGEQSINNQIFTSSYSMQPDPSWATMWFTCDQIGQWNAQRWCNAEFDDLHRQGLVTLDEAKRQEIYVKMQQLWEDAAQAIWITNGNVTFAYSPKIKPATSPNGFPQVEYFLPA